MTAPSWPVTVVVGNPKPHSRTLNVAVETGGALWRRLTAAGTEVSRPRVVDLADLTPELVGQGDRSELLDEILESIRLPGLLVAASPTFKGSYSGLLKLFIDLLPRSALSDVVAVPLMTAASIRHQHVVDSCLRPLLMEAGAFVPASGLCVLEREFDAVEQAVERWLSVTAPVLAAVLGARL